MTPSAVITTLSLRFQTPDERIFWEAVLVALIAGPTTPCVKGKRVSCQEAADALLLDRRERMR